MSVQKKNCTGVRQEILAKPLPSLFRVVDGDVLKGTNVLLHCISADKAMSDGIARDIQAMYQIRDKLPRDLYPTNSYFISTPQRKVLNLVTKDRFYQKPKLFIYRSTVTIAAQACQLHGITEVDMPPLGMGRDQIDPNFAIPFIAEAFCSLGIKVNLYWPREHQVLPKEEGRLHRYYTARECVSTCEECGKRPEDCRCIFYGPENRLRFQILHSCLQGMKKSEVPAGYVWIWHMVRSFADDCSLRKNAVIGVDGCVPFGKFRVVFYGQDKGKSFIPLPFTDGRTAYWYFRRNPWLLFRSIYVSTFVPKVVRYVPPEKKPTPSSPKPGLPKPEASTSHKVTVVKFKKPAPIVRTPKRHVDFDKESFKVSFHQAKKSKEVATLTTPESMKVSFAREKLEKPKLVDLAFHSAWKNVHGMLNKRQYDMAKIFKYDLPLDSFLLEYYQKLVQTGSYSAAANALYMRWQKGGVSDRNLWFRLSVLAKTEGIPNILPIITQEEIRDPFLRRHMRNGERVAKLLGGRHSINDIGDRGLDNYVNYFMLYVAFRDYVREKLGYKKLVLDMSPNILVNGFLSECTTYYLKPTMHSVPKAMSKISKIDVKSLNTCLKEAKNAIKKSGVTMEKLNGMMDGLDLGSLNNVLGGLSSVIDYSKEFLSTITTPILTKALETIFEYLRIPKQISKDVREKFTPLTVGLITSYFILYQHSDSKLVKTLMILAGLKTLGILDAMTPLLGKFIAGFRKWWQPENDEEAVPTSFGGFSTVIAAIVGGGGTLVEALIGGFASAFGSAVTSVKCMRGLLSRVGAFGRDLNFSYLGLAKLPDIFHKIIGAFMTVSAWLFGTSKPVTELEIWQERFMKWRVMLHVLEDPRLRNLLRVSEQARSHVDKLYDEGTSLLNKARELSTLPRREVCEISALFRRVKDLIDNITHYREYSSQKITPYSICLTSEAGVGKTNMVHVIANLFHKHVYPDIDPTSLVYNVPLDGDHMDGYAKQKIMVCDDYNLIDDPSWVAKMAPLVSNVPRVLPMSHLGDKGIVQESDIIIKTTNNAYLIPNGVTHHAATLRRNNVVVKVTVPKWAKKDGRVNSDAVYDHYRNELSTQPGLSPEMLDTEIRKKMDSLEYYSYTLMEVMTNNPKKTMSAKEFYTFLLQDFYKHRAREEDLLARNENVPVDEEEIANMVGFKCMVDRMRGTIMGNQERLRELFDKNIEPEESEGLVFEMWKVLKVRSAEVRKKILDEPCTFLETSYESIKEYLSAYRLRRTFEVQLNGSLSDSLDEVLSESSSSEGESSSPDFMNPFDPEDTTSTDLGTESEEEVTETMFRWFSGARSEAGTSVSSASEIGDEEEPQAPVPSETPLFSYTGRAEGAFYARLNLTAGRIPPEDLDDEEVPRLGWIEKDLFAYHSAPAYQEYVETRPVVNGRPLPLIPIVNRLATEFVMRLRCEHSSYLGYRTLLSNIHVENSPNEAGWYLHYPDGNNGIGQFQLDKESSWFKESLFAFSMISTEQRFEILDLRESMIQDYLMIREIVRERVIVHREEFVRDGFWWNMVSGVGKMVVEAGLIMICGFVYFAFVLGLVWLFTPPEPRGTATKYNVDPRKTGVNKLKWSPTASVEQVQNIRLRLQSNLQLIARQSRAGGDAMDTAQLFYVNGTYALVPRHFFYDFDEQESWFVSITSPEFPDLENAQEHLFCKRDMVEIPGRDAILVNVRGQSRCLRSALKYFITRDEVAKLNGGDIRIYQRDICTKDVMCASTQVLSTAEITLRTLVKPVVECLYAGSVECGSSGGPVFWLDKNSPRSLCGIQSATARSWGCFSPLALEDIAEAMEKLHFPVFQDINLDEEVYECNRKLVLETTQILGTTASQLFTNTIVVGVQKKENSLPIMVKTSFAPTPISSLLPSTGREPAILSPWDSRRLKYVDKPHFLHKSLNKFCRDKMQPVNPSEIDAVVDGLTTMYINTGCYENLRTLTIHEAITAQGLDCSPLDLTTSPGLPWSLEKNRMVGKTQWIRRSDDGSVVYLAKELEDACVDTLEMCRSNIVPAYLQNDFMKDELRDARLGKENVTRLVTVMPLHITLVGRQLNLDWHSRVHKRAKTAAPICVGVNVESRSAHLMVQRLCSVAGGMNCFDFDAANWDGHFPAWMLELIARVRNNLYHRAGDKIENCTARYVWMLAMFYGYIQIGTIVYQKNRGMSSGSCGTAEDNSEGHAGLVYVIWRRLVRKANRRDLLSMHHFMLHVVYFCYGDDIVFSVSDEVVSFFNGITVAAEYEKLGWPVTPARKGESIQCTKLWTELTFLKRRFVLDRNHNVVYSPLEMETIRSLFSWQRGSSRDQFYQNLYDAFRFLVHHGKGVFDSSKGVVNRALDIMHMPHVSFRFEDFLEEFLDGYDKVD